MRNVRVYLSILKNIHRHGLDNDGRRRCIELDYPVTPRTRWGYGAPPHEGISVALEAGRDRYREHLHRILGLREELRANPGQKPDLPDRADVGQRVPFRPRLGPRCTRSWRRRTHRCTSRSAPGTRPSSCVERSRITDCTRRWCRWIPNPAPRSTQFVTRSSAHLLKMSTCRSTTDSARGTCCLSTTRTGAYRTLTRL